MPHLHNQVNDIIIIIFVINNIIITLIGKKDHLFYIDYDDKDMEWMSVNEVIKGISLYFNRNEKVKKRKLH